MNIDASFRNIRFNLNYTLGKKEEYKNDLISLNEENYGFFLVRIATECTLLLDQFMEVVWEKLGDLEKKKPRLYFPVFDDELKFEKIIRDKGINVIKKEIPDLFEVIKDVQPFKCGQSWLFYQYNIANERHSNPQLVYEYRSKNSLYIMMPHAVGEEAKAYITKPNGDKEFAHIRRYGIPNRPLPEVRLKNEEEAINFIENCILGTNSLICDMIDCFERKL